MRAQPLFFYRHSVKSFLVFRVYLNIEFSACMLWVESILRNTVRKYSHEMFSTCSSKNIVAVMWGDMKNQYRVSMKFICIDKISKHDMFAHS